MAAAKEDTFDDVVMSNDEDLCVQILTWSRRCVAAVSLEKKTAIQSAAGTLSRMFCSTIRNLHFHQMTSWFDESCTML